MRISYILVVKGFSQFGPVCFLQCFRGPERNIGDSRLIEPATDIDRDLFI
jgi:hypothetical protein